jgi:fructan beta-fructosidase
MFAIPSMNAPLKSDGNTVTLDFFVDQSSVELFAGGGRISMTNLVFPQTIYNQLSVTGATYEAKVRKLQSVWK